MIKINSLKFRLGGVNYFTNVPTKVKTCIIIIKYVFPKSYDHFDHHYPSVGGPNVGIIVSPCP